LKDLYLIDGSSLIYKGFYAIRNLTRSNGDPVNALYGLSRMMIKLLKDKIKIGDNVVFVMDKSRKTFRSEMYPEYKANRQAMPEDLRFQMQYIEKLMNSMGIKCSSMDNYEADDIIATMAVQNHNDFDSVFIVSGDKDLLQLIEENVYILRTEKGVTDIVKYDSQKVQDKYNLSPAQILDYLSIVGDKSDNVPGVKGIGDKGAVALLNKYPTLEKIYDNLDNISGKTKEKLFDSKEVAFLSKKLITLCSSVPDLPEINEFNYDGIRFSELKTLFDELEFKKLFDEIDVIFKSATDEQMKMFDSVAVEKEKTSYSQDYVLIKNEEEFMSLIDKISDKKNICFDLETNSLNQFKAEISGISVCLESGESYYIPFNHFKNDNLDKSFIEKLTRSFKDKLIIGHNLKYDLSVLASNGYKTDFNIFDTMVAMYLIDPDRQRYKLDILIKELFDYEMQSFDDLMKKNPLSTDFSYIPVDEATFYSCEDADFTFRLFEYSNEKMKELDLENIFYNVEMPFLRVIMEMEKNGVYFDIEELNIFSIKLQERLTEIENEIFKIAGESFNVNSPIQVAQIFFEKLKIPPKKKTSKSKNYSTNQAVLEELSKDYPIAAFLLEFRKLKKLKSSYVDSIPKLVNKDTGRVHSTFKQTGTATGRISSTEPNLQNLPIKTEEGREIRNSIKPQYDNWKIISADYSQIELRLMADLSRDENLIEAFEQDKDIHTFTSSKIFNVPFADVDKDMRRIGKTINFSIIYGISAFGLSNRLSISRKDAADFIKNYFIAYSGIERYMEETVEKAEKNGYVRTLFGRLRQIKFINSRNKNLKEEAKRIAINSPVQGTAADIVKMAMNNVSARIKKESLKSKIIIQIHDEIVIESPDEEVDRIKVILKEEMENVVKLKVPLSVDIEIGNHF